MPRRSRFAGPGRRRPLPDPSPEKSPDPQPHEVLGLPSCEDDAVRVIEVAHTLLTQWRRFPLAGPSGRAGPPAGARSTVEARSANLAHCRIRQIIAAREAMLERIHARRLRW